MDCSATALESGQKNISPTAPTAFISSPTKDRQNILGPSGTFSVFHNDMVRQKRHRSGSKERKKRTVLIAFNINFQNVNGCYIALVQDIQKWPHTYPVSWSILTHPATSEISVRLNQQAHSVMIASGYLKQICFQAIERHICSESVKQRPVRLNGDNAGVPLSGVQGKEPHVGTNIDKCPTSGQVTGNPPGLAMIVAGTTDS